MKRPDEVQGGCDGVAGATGLGAAIELRALTKRYGAAAPAVDDVSLDVAPGEFVTFLGPSGSGKTTTLMMIAGFATPTTGDILLDGTSLLGVPANKRDIGMVFQNYALFPHMTVARNVAFPLEMRRVDRAEVARRVGAALGMVRLGGYGDRKPRQLSGGQQQRVALARALVFHPRVLLLDEPLGALDAKLRDEMKFELKRLHAELGCTILFVTHDQEEALTLSDRIAVFSNGRIAQYGQPQELYRAPRNRFVADFIGETNLLEGPVVGRSDAAVTVEVGPLTRILVPPRAGFPAPNRTALCAVRPEAIRLSAANAAAQEGFAGVVVELLYAGSSIKYLIRLHDGTLLKARATADAAERPLAAGAEVAVSWDPNATLLVEADPTAFGAAT